MFGVYVSLRERAGAVVVSRTYYEKKAQALGIASGWWLLSKVVKQPWCVQVFWTESPDGAVVWERGAC